MVDAYLASMRMYQKTASERLDAPQYEEEQTCSRKSELASVALWL